MPINIFIIRGSFINKSQNDIILLIFKIWKFGNIRFVGNLIGDIYWNFYDDDVIAVTSLVFRTQPVSPVFCPTVFFCNSQVLICHASHVILICHASRVMPYIILNRLRQYSERELPEEQAGFRVGRRTRDMLFILQLVIEKTLELEEKEVYLIYVDYSKAFDTVDHQMLFETTKKQQVDGMSNWQISFKLDKGQDKGVMSRRQNIYGEINWINKESKVRCTRQLMIWTGRRAEAVFPSRMKMVNWLVIRSWWGTGGKNTLRNYIMRKANPTVSMLNQQRMW